MSPLGTLLNPTTDKSRMITKHFATGIPVAGLLGVFLNIGLLWGVAGLALIAYQWVINGMMIRENSRQF